MNDDGDEPEFRREFHITERQLDAIALDLGELVAAVEEAADDLHHSLHGDAFGVVDDGPCDGARIELSYHPAERVDDEIATLAFSEVQSRVLALVADTDGGND